MSNRERLVARIYRDIQLMCNPSTFRRTHRGYWQKRAGAWAWEMKTSDDKYLVGSVDTLTDILKSKTKLVVFEQHGLYLEICLDE